MTSYDRKLFIIFGIVFLLMSALFNVATISTGAFPAGHDIMLLAVTLSCFCNAYLAPQFVQKDERVKRIKERGVYLSYFIVLAFIIVLTALLHFEVLHLSGYQAISLLAAFMIGTVFVAFVVLARKY
ncbi:hypothetical protein [Gracilibacillus timonensis]|uniref:hypothetical protein n=1 Tax=Gracilibacillus timonensis TaxID=1816696 RepID=UPI00082676BB|nr:hypothetical protein [Gracilibacillus timonensis]